MQKTFLLIIVVSLASVKLSAQPAQSASNPLPSVSGYLNEELPNWLRIGGEFRARLEGFTSGGGFKKDTTDDYLLTRTRINLTIEPALWLRVFVQGQDSHALWKNQHPEAPPFQSTMNLRQAYLELGNTTKGPIGFRVGRQEFAFGEERLIGPSGWLNTPRFFEAARLTLRHGRYRLDAFASSVIVVQAEHYSKAQPPNNLHGLYGGIDNLIPNSTIEPYVLWRLQRNLRTEAGKPGNMDFKAGGIRWAGKVPAVLGFSEATASAPGVVTGWWAIPLNSPSTNRECMENTTTPRRQGSGRWKTRHVRHDICHCARSLGSGRPDRLAEHTPRAPRLRNSCAPEGAAEDRVSRLLARQRYRWALCRQRHAGGARRVPASARKWTFRRSARSIPLSRCFPDLQISHLELS